MVPKSDDRVLARKALDGDREAFRALVVAHQSRVYLCIKRIVSNDDEAEDLAQEAFVRAYTRLRAYDPQWEFSTWISTIATRLALNWRRAAGYRETESLDNADGLPSRETLDSSESPRQSAERRESVTRLEEALGSLSQSAQTIFCLRHQNQCSIRQIAETMGLSEGAVKVALHRARKTLRAQLGNFCDYYD